MNIAIKTISFSVLLFSSFFVSKNVVAKQPKIDKDHKPKQYGAPFTKVPAREDAIIYQVNMRAFSKGGNFAGVTARLDSIKSLGANVIYLMPIYPVGTINSVNSPYCIKDYTSINKEFGKLEDLRALIDGAHSRDMSVMLDWVGNHTAWDHPWVNAHKNWYKQDSVGNIIPPRPDWKDVAQLDYSNLAMRQEMIASMKYWVLAANIDGFRCDYADGPPVDFWKQAIDTLRSVPGHKLLFLAEGMRNDNYSAGFDYNFGFNFFGHLEAIYNKDLTVLCIDSLNRIENAGSVNGQQIVRYTTNHDVNGSDGTPIKLFGGKEGSMSAFVVAACMDAIPMIYNGQEVDMAQSIPFPFTSVKIDWNVNHDATAVYKKIIAFRNNSKAIKKGILVSYSNNDICAFTKTADSDTVFIFSNMRNKTADITIPKEWANTSWINVIDNSKVKFSDKVKLHAYTYMILKKV